MMFTHPLIPQLALKKKRAEEFKAWQWFPLAAVLSADAVPPVVLPAAPPCTVIAFDIKTLTGRRVTVTAGSGDTIRVRTRALARSPASGY
jgi:hypothetical protein